MCLPELNLQILKKSAECMYQLRPISRLTKGSRLHIGRTGGCETARYVEHQVLHSRGATCKTCRAIAASIPYHRRNPTLLLRLYHEKCPKVRSPPEQLAIKGPLQEQVPSKCTCKCMSTRARATASANAIASVRSRASSSASAGPRRSACARPARAGLSRPVSHNFDRERR